MQKEFLPIVGAVESRAQRRANMGWVGVSFIVIGSILFFMLLIADSPVGQNYGVSMATGRDSDQKGVWLGVRRKARR